MTGSQRSSISEMNIEEPGDTSGGFFSRASSKKTFLFITGGFAVAAVVALVIALPVYFSGIEDPKQSSTSSIGVITVPSTTSTDETSISPPEDVMENEKYDCYPDDSTVTQQMCLERGCVWTGEIGNSPSCVYKPNSRMYQLNGDITDNGDIIQSTLIQSDYGGTQNHFGKQFDVLNMKTTYISATTLRIQIFPDSERFEVPMEHPSTITRPVDALYQAQHTDDGGVAVWRDETSTVLFNTSIGQLMFADQFLQISTSVASEYVYGFGEHMHLSFKHDMNWKTYGMFSRDQGVGANVNLYGVHPYFTCMEGDGNAYGVYLVNSNAMDVTMQPNPAITYRSVGGVFDFYIFLGPTPEEVTSQYTALIGRPYFPPYWSLGFQLSRYDYENLGNLTKVFDRNIGKIPYEVQYSDIDYMERQLDFTIDPVAYDGLEDFVREVKTNYSMKYIIILDPAISGNESVGSYPPFEYGVRDGVFIKTPDGDIAWGKVWPDYPNVTVDESKDWEYQTENYRAYAAFPDFSLPETEQWWINLTIDFHQRIEFDGLWIDMNEPASFVAGSPSGCPENSLDYPPYVPGLASGNIYDKTLCMNNKQFNPATGSDTDHYNMHSLYGRTQTLPTLHACRNSTGERCIVISRSTYPGSGKYVGHWLGDNTSIWEHLRTSIIGMLEFNLFGIPYIGADVCGFFVDTTEELCRRWMQLGAFYPFDRNHNGKGWADQDPGYFGEKFLEDSKKVLDVRYTLLPYLYTLFYEAHTTGATVVRSMMHQFPTDINTYEIDRQFLWGSALVVTPVVEENTTAVEGYFPAGRWFDYFSGAGMDLTDGTFITLPTPMDHINVHLYGGNIIPTQEPALTTSESRKNPFGLIVAVDSNSQASGSLFWDDGSSIDTISDTKYNMIDFEYQNNNLNVTPRFLGLPTESMTLGSIRVLGLSELIVSVIVDGVDHTDFMQDNITFELKINGLMKDMIVPIEISWNATKDYRRVDCYPDSSSGIASACQARGCTYAGNMNPLGPWCIYDGPSLYTVAATQTGRDVRDTSLTDTLTATDGVLDHFGENFARLTVETSYISATTLRVKIHPESGSNRFEVPLDHPEAIERPSDALYNVEHFLGDADRFGVKVERASKSRVLFDTSAGELMFSEQYLQITTKVASEYVYGFGEHMHLDFKHDMSSRKSYGMFSRDQGVGPDVNLYGVHPYFMCMEGDGDAYGVYFVNSNAMEVVLEPRPAITYRTVGGVLDFYIFLGPTPEQVTSQYTEIIGRPYFPPYWSLGFQLSRYGYENLENLTRVFNRNIGKIPYEIQYSDIDYMERQLDFTIDPVAYDGLEDFVRTVKNDYNMRYIIILDPAISGNETSGSYPPFDQGVVDDVFIKTPDGDIAWGKVWPDLPGVEVDDTQDWDYQTENYRAYAAFPDFSLPITEEWWTNLTVDFHKRIEFDGLWIDMNEPASFVHGSPDGCPGTSVVDNPPYIPNLASENIYDKTLCMQSVQYNPVDKGNTQHYNMHSLYGKSQALPSLNACRKSTGERCIVISRSTYPGSGKYVGHWLGDNASIWQHLATSIIGMMEFNLFGIPYIGADVCGFFVDTTNELCMRWMQLGAFYPFDRNHNGINWRDQDPGYFGEEFLANSKKVLDVRYTLLPYLYTLFYDSHTTGATVVRPMMNQFPKDIISYTVDEQFLWGPALLISPALYEGQTSVRGYFPSGVWYNYYSGERRSVDGTWLTLHTPLDHINVHIYGGNIIPTQEPALTTFESRQNPFGLIVALDENMMATGSLFWDDGSSIDTIDKMEYTSVDFECSNNLLKLTPSVANVDGMILGSIRVLGLSEMMDYVLVDGANHMNFTQDSITLELKIMGIEKSMTSPIEISWSVKMVDCFPESSSGDRTQCEARGCTFIGSTSSPGPWCVYEGTSIYQLQGVTDVNDGGISSTLQSTENILNHFGDHIDKLKVQTTYISPTTLRVKISPEDLSLQRFEVPMDHPTGVPKPETALYNVEHLVSGDGEFGVKVERASNSRVLFDTSVGELMFADQFLQITTRVASEYVYGFGEHMHLNFKHDMAWKSFGMFSRDQRVGADVNLYGVHPYFLCMEGDGDAYGVYFVNSNAMDVTFEPMPAITYRTVGGILDFYIFLGPSPEQVTTQYTEIIGRPYFPPYWSLGFQLSRYDYENLENLTRVFDRNIGKIPYEVQYSDIDYMERQLDFTIDPVAYDGLEDFVRMVKNDYNMKYIIILDPAISGNETSGSYPPFDQGVTDDVFIKTPNGDIAWGKVWPDLPGVVVDDTQDWEYQTENYRAYAAFPDFSLPSTEQWWTNLTIDFHKRIEFDGLWIDMNEPASFVHGSPNGCPDNDFDNPPYVPNLASGKIYDKTLCMQSMQYNPATGGTTQHYNMHSLYGKSQSLPSLNACRKSTGERCIVISRSTYPGSGKYVGHWLGDNTSIWQHLATSIIGMMEFNLFGIPYIGADVCGFFEDTTEELCMRWMQLGAFYPFDRNHNGIGWRDQDPGYFGEEFLRNSSEVLFVRYTLLPYLYKLFYESHLSGATVVRPMMNQFPNDPVTFTVDKQFLWGSALLITAVLEEGKTSVDGYFPNGQWYDYYSGKKLDASGNWVTLDAPLNHINVHIYGGNVIPTQEPALTTFESRSNPFGLIVALDSTGNAAGNMFWDDGTSINTIENMEYTLVEFHCSDNTLTNVVRHTNLAGGSLMLSTIRILGVPAVATRVIIDGGSHDDFIHDPDTLELRIQNMVGVSLNSLFEIKWEINDAWKRIDCTPSKSTEPSEAECLSRNCVWDDSTDVKCSYPSESGRPSYQVSAVGASSYNLMRDASVGQRYGSPVDALNLEIEHQTEHRLHFKIKDSGGNSFEVPEELNNFPKDVLSDEASALYSVEITENPFSITVKRKETGKVLFDSSVGPLVYEEKYREISTSLPSALMFGLGEHNHRRYRHDFNWKRWAIFTRDVAPIDEWNFYGHQTFYMAVDDVDAGTAVGVYLHNSNAMDVTLSPDPMLTYRVTGGVLDFYIFVGNTQEEVVQQYHALIGTPVMPPYWGLGFQLSRWGYQSLDEIKGIYQEMRDAKIPYDIQYGDIDYMEAYKSFTYDKTNYADLPGFVDELHDAGMKFVIILDPGIKIESGYKAYEEGIEKDIYIKNPEGEPLITEVWPGETHHPDYTHPNVTDWWHDQCLDFYQNQNVKYDALWIDMNEPANFQPDDPEKLKNMNCSDEYNRIPYMPNILGYWNGLHDKSICMENLQYQGLHYDFHSLYGHTMTLSTYNALERIMPDKRSFVITRSSFTGTGKYAGHWLGDNQSQWRQIPWPIPAMFEFNLFGFAWIGADVCGFYFDTSEELCMRWMQVGAFYPFSRNHNAADMIPQHPTVFGESFANASREILEIRYDILPYMYTAHYEANALGGTVVRALVHEFPNDRNAWDADGQFLLGSGFLITPVLEEGATSVTGYFPGAARWYDYRTGKEITLSGRSIQLDAPLEYINLHVRGGTIFPKQDHAVTTSLARQNPMSLLVALDANGVATGRLYWDDGEERNVGDNYLYLQFTCNESSLVTEVTHPIEGTLDVTSLKFERVVVYGLDELVENVTVDGESVDTFTTADNNVLVVYDLSMTINTNHDLFWSFASA